MGVDILCVEMLTSVGWRPYVICAPHAHTTNQPTKPNNQTQAQNINKSLSALGDVIQALAAKSAKGAGHVPYRYVACLSGLHTLLLAN